MIPYWINLDFQLIYSSDELNLDILRRNAEKLESFNNFLHTTT